MASEVLNVQGLDDMPLTIETILNDRTVPVQNRGYNYTQESIAVKVLQEWCGEHGFIKNAKVKEILLAEVNRINRMSTTTQGEQ